MADLVANNHAALAIGPFGSRMKSDLYVAAGVPVIRGNNISDTKALAGDFVFITEDTARQLASAVVRDGDLIFPHRGLIGTVGIVSGQPDARYMLSTSLMKLTPNRAFIDPLYLFYYFRSPRGRHELLKNASQVGTPGIATPLASLKSARVWLPPLFEQRAIAAVLGSLDDKIELNRRMNQTLEAISEALFRAWFVDFEPVRAKAERRTPAGLSAELADLFPEEFEESELGPIPRGWEIAPIGELVRVVGGSTPSTKEPAFWVRGQHYWATPKDLSNRQDPVLLATERQITDAGLQQISSGLLPAGTVLLSSRAPIGYLAISEVPIAVNQGFIAMVCNGRVSNQYVLQWARGNLDTIKGRANGTTFQEISKANFRPILVLVPPGTVMDAFTAAADTLHQRVVASLRESGTLAELRDTLLPKLLSGEIRVREAEQAVAAVT